MKIISDRELMFLEQYRDRKKSFKSTPPTPENIVMEICLLYVIAQNDNDKEDAAWMIYRLKPEYKTYISKWYFDLDEKFTELVENRKKKITRITLAAQERRHQKREDFALTQEQWEETCRHFDYACVYCGSEEKLTYDHFIAFSKGGSFEVDNVLPSCKRCNSSKRDSPFEEWYPRQQFFSEDKESKIFTFIRDLQAEKALS